MPLTLPSTDSIIRQDQARELRAMVANRNGAATVAPQPDRRCRTVAIVGSKGGVGKSVVTLNLAFALARTGAFVGMVDASPGTGSLGLLCRQNCYWNLDHVAAGTRTLDEISLNAGPNVTLLPGADRLRTGPIPTTLWHTLTDFESRQDWLLIDTGADLNQATDFARMADAVVIVTTPEPTSVAEAYAAIKRFVAQGITASILVNQVDTPEQGRAVQDRLRHATRTFLAGDIGLAGVVPFDLAIGQAVFHRTLLSNGETSAAQLALEAVAGRLLRTVVTVRKSSPFESLRTLLKANRECGAGHESGQSSCRSCRSESSMPEGKEIDPFAGEADARVQLQAKANCVGRFSEVGPVGLSRRNKVN